MSCHIQTDGCDSDDISGYVWNDIVKSVTIMDGTLRNEEGYKTPFYLCRSLFVISKY